MGREGQSITRQGINKSTQINGKLGVSPPKLSFLSPSPFPVTIPVLSPRCSRPPRLLLQSSTLPLLISLSRAPYLLSGRYDQVPTKCSSTDNYKQINSMCAAMRRCPYAPTTLPNHLWGMAATLSKININENAENLIEELGHLLKCSPCQGEGAGSAQVGKRAGQTSKLLSLFEVLIA